MSLLEANSPQIYIGSEPPAHQWRSVPQYLKASLEMTAEVPTGAPWFYRL